MIGMHHLSVTWLCAAGVAACTASQSVSFGVVTNVTGQVTMVNHSPNTKIAYLDFINEGTTDITIDQVSYTFGDGGRSVTQALGAPAPTPTLDLAAGDSQEPVLCVNNGELPDFGVTSISFVVDGTAVKLEVTGFPGPANEAHMPHPSTAR